VADAIVAFFVVFVVIGLRFLLWSNSIRLAGFVPNRIDGTVPYGDEHHYDADSQSSESALHMRPSKRPAVVGDADAVEVLLQRLTTMTKWLLLVLLLQGPWEETIADHDVDVDRLTVDGSLSTALSLCFTPCP
jgi:hypothetical protein